MSARRSAPQLVASQPAARPVTVLFADQDVWYWIGAASTAADELSATPVGNTDQLLAAACRLREARAQLAAAQRKLRRVVAEADGRRWLRLVVANG